jgi:hypothetical protein
MALQIQIRRDSASNWLGADPILAEGEFGYDTTNEALKLGDGTSAWSSLPVLFQGGAANPLILGSEGIQFDTIGSPTTTPEGRVWWDLTDHTLAIKPDIASSTMQVGQEMWVRVRNPTGATISDGQVVYINGSTGSRPRIALAQANSDSVADKVIGVSTADIANNSDGFVTSFGLVRGLNTSVDCDGVSLSDGDTLYLCATQAGRWVKTKPTFPNVAVKIGHVIYAHNSNGIILVSPQTGTHLSDQHDVLINTPTNGQVLKHDGSKWVNSTVSSSLGYTPVNKAGDTMTGDLKLDLASFIVPGQTGYGIKMDTGAATYGWADLLGGITTRNTGPTAPSFNVFRGGLRQYQFTVNDEEFVDFHIPHDYAPGTDLFIHAHWAHAASNVTSGGVTWGFEVSYAKGHNQAAFSAPITTTVQQDASTTQYQHMIAEIQLTASSPNANQFSSSLLEADGVLMVRSYLSGNTINGTPEPFLLFVDIHYQTKTVGTKNKAPNFYTT